MAYTINTVVNVNRSHILVMHTYLQTPRAKDVGLT